MIIVFALVSVLNEEEKLDCRFKKHSLPPPPYVRASNETSGRAEEAAA